MVGNVYGGGWSGYGYSEEFKQAKTKRIEDEAAKKAAEAAKTAAAANQPITRQTIDTVSASATKDTPATQTMSTVSTASNAPAAIPVQQGILEANDTSAGSVILGGGASTGGGYQGVADSPLGASGQENQFLRRMGSILLR